MLLFSNTLLHMEAAAHIHTYLEVAGVTGVQLVPAGPLHWRICGGLDESVVKGGEMIIVKKFSVDLVFWKVTI